MKHSKYLRKYVLFTLFFFTSIRIFCFFLSLYNYLIGINHYYNGLSSKGKELLDIYFANYHPTYYEHLKSIRILIGYFTSYIVFDWVIFNENSKIIAFLSKYFTFLSNNLFSEDKLICNTLCAIIAVLTISTSFTMLLTLPIIYFIVLFMTFSILYFLSYKVFVVLLSLQILFISSMQFVIYYSDFALVLYYRNIVPYSYENFRKPVREFFEKKEFYNFFIGSSGSWAEYNAFAVSSAKRKAICIGEKFNCNEDLHYCLIHEYGHLWNEHSYYFCFKYFLLSFIPGGLFIMISIILVKKSNYVSINKKLYFFVIFSILNMITFPTYISAINNSLHVQMEWQADNYAINQGFAWGNGYEFIKFNELYPKYYSENYTISTLQNRIDSTHPTNFMRVLHSARSL